MTTSHEDTFTNYVRANNPRAKAFFDELDAAFRKTAIPFPVVKAGARKSKSKRVVLVEQFSTAQDGTVVAGDAAFDAARKAYSSDEVVFLRYHVHVDAPDALANPGGQARRQFYEPDIAANLPAMLVDGRTVPAVVGANPKLKAYFDTVSEKIDAARETDASATITLRATKTKGKVAIEAKITGLTMGMSK